METNDVVEHAAQLITDAEARLKHAKAEAAVDTAVRIRRNNCKHEQEKVLCRYPSETDYIVECLDCGHVSAPELFFMNRRRVRMVKAAGYGVSYSSPAHLTVSGEGDKGTILGLIIAAAIFAAVLSLLAVLGIWRCHD